MMVLLELVLLVIAAFYLFYWWQYGYWSRKNVPFMPPSIPLGNTGNVFKCKVTPCIRLNKQYEFCKSNGYKHCGLWLMWTPIYVPVDPAIIKRIMVSECESFMDRGFYTNVKHDPLTGMVLLLHGPLWKRLRTLLTPTFTSGKLKSMFPVMLQCSNQLVDVIHKLDHSKPIDVKELAACYTTDVICACSFGLDCNTCANPNENIRAVGKKTLTYDKKRAIKNFITLTMPKLCTFLNVKIIPNDVTEYFMGTIRSAMDYRKDNNFHRKDLLQSLMEMHDEKKLTFNELTAQAFAFYLAGFETSSATITFTIFELARNVDVQERARREINEVVARHNGELTYDGISEMTYLRQVLDEALRMYPPLPVTIRRCIKDYVEPETGVTIDKGTLLYIMIRSLHYDPEYFPEPEKFDPERFNKENKPHIKPFTYLPFGDGPRNCLGARFGLVQTSLAIASILRNYRFTMHKKTVLPIHYNHFNFTLDLESDFYLSMERLDVK